MHAMILFLQVKVAGFQFGCMGPTLIMDGCSPWVLSATKIIQGSDELMVSPDSRLRAFSMLICFGLIGHICQLISEDRFWDPQARTAMWISPGWHLALHPLVPLTVGFALLV